MPMAMQKGLAGRHLGNVVFATFLTAPRQMAGLRAPQSRLCARTQMVGLQEPPEGGHVVAKTIQVF